MAIGKLFDIQGKAIIPKPDCYIIQPINTVIEAYPKEHPRILAFLHYMKSMRPDDNPYADVPIDERAEQILYDLKLDIDPEDPLITDALQCVEEKYATPMYRIHRGIKAQLDKIGMALLVTEPIMGGKDANAMNISRFMKEYEVLSSTYKKSYKDFEEEQTGMKVRGGGSLADDEDKDY